MRRRILFVVAFVVLGAGCLPDGDAGPQSGGPRGSAAAPMRVRPAATMPGCTSQKSIFEGTIQACVQKNNAGQLNAVLNYAIGSLHTVSIELLACNPTCSVVANAGDFVTGHEFPVTPIVAGVHGYSYKARYSIDTNGPPDNEFDSDPIDFP